MTQTIFSYDTPVILLGGGDINWPVLQHYVDLGYPVVAADGAANALGGWQHEVVTTGTRTPFAIPFSQVLR